MKPHVAHRSGTIAAIATPPGEGGLSVLRISGDQAPLVLASVFRPAGGPRADRLPSHQLTYGHVVDPDGQRVDEVMAVLMRAPRSYTREDVAEIHCHGGHLITRRILALVLQAGARPAEPGEFTRRAFEQGRIDLSQAEAVMQLIGAGSQRAAEAALHQMEGGVSRGIAQARQGVTGLLAAVEASVDFPDEVDEVEATRTLLPQTLDWARRLREACDPRRAKVLREGLRVVIVGPPNAGKSSLLNALLHEERAIVTDIPGTTRDVLTESLWLDGLLVLLSDTAGQRDQADPIEQIGISRAQEAMRQADVCLMMLDASAPWDPSFEPLLALPFSGDRLLLLNKGDLPSVLTSDELKMHAPEIPVLSLSAKTGEGLDALTDRLLQYALGRNPGEGILTNLRHIEAATAAADALEAAAAAMQEGVALDLCAVDLRSALYDLGSITGEEVDEEVLDRIFEDFCVGK